MAHRPVAPGRRPVAGNTVYVLRVRHSAQALLEPGEL
jgi:hypothetical protein